MLAAVLERIPSESLAVREVDSATANEPGRLLIGVHACGICGTDLHILDGASYRPALPFVLGHEPVGTVIDAHDEADRRWIGRRVTMTLFTGCGRCAMCRSGRERICRNMVEIVGIDRAWGAFAERMSVPTARCVELPGDLVDSRAASLVDAGATAMNCVRSILDRLDGSVTVVGGGPVGFLTAEMLRHRGAEPLVIEPVAGRRDALAQLGHKTVATLDDAVGEVGDVVVDCSGASGVTPWALEQMAPAGVLVVAGYARSPDLDFAPLARKELRVVGIRSGSRTDLVSAIDLASSGAIALPQLSEWPLADVNDALEALRAGDVPGKAIVAIADGVKPQRQRR